MAQLRFHEGDDLNGLVYRFYSSEPSPHFKGVNFVSPHEIAARRYEGHATFFPRHWSLMRLFAPLSYEYLGPAPYVTGYRFDAEAKTARIEWWDAYIQQMWIGDKTWKIEVYFDEVVGGWVSRPRGDFDEAPDMRMYLGL